LKTAETAIHPARWEEVYAPLLRILELDVLSRFSEKEKNSARELISGLPPPIDLR
jgi:hypothetical protein